ncbi:hypothetical protein SCB49_03439 [unidentified eubacterium SCB49]|nr:hypothetical protein SCB49_03439 [unidentified eubacterium SCB49]
MARPLFITFVKVITFSNKSKQYLLVALKVLILASVLFFLYNKITRTETTTWSQFKNHIFTDFGETKWILLSVLLLTTLNWLLEILKWKSLVSYLKPITFIEAARQTLAGSTLTFITPAKIGDYGIKASYHPINQRKQIVLLNLISNLSQMAITVMLGIVGCYYLAYHKEMSDIKSLFPWLCLLGILGLFLLWIFKNKQWFSKGVSLKNGFLFFSKINRKIKLKILLYALLRYVCFSFSFYLLIRVFGGDITLIDALAPIVAMYFLASVLPSFFIIDVAVRGGIAAYLLAPFDVSALPVLTTSLTMWLLNFALPAIIGSYFVLTYKATTAQ